MKNIKIGGFYKLDDSTVEVLGVKTRGWISVKFCHNGETVNVRSNRLTEPVADTEPVAEFRMGKIGKTLVDLRCFKYSGKRTVSGRKCFDVGDSVAQLLRGEDIEDVYCIVAERIGMPVDYLKERYGHLNVGMQRMTLGNRLRKVFKG